MHQNRAQLFCDCNLSIYWKFVFQAQIVIKSQMNYRLHLVQIIIGLAGIKLIDSLSAV